MKLVQVTCPDRAVFRTTIVGNLRQIHAISSPCLCVSVVNYSRFLPIDPLEDPECRHKKFCFPLTVFTDDLRYLNSRRRLKAMAGQERSHNAMQHCVEERKEHRKELRKSKDFFEFFLPEADK